MRRIIVLFRKLRFVVQEKSPFIMDSSEQRKAYLRRIIQKDSLDDIYSDERKSQWNALSRDDQKKVMESKVFIGFAKVSGVVVAPFEHDNAEPPFPDIRVIVQDSTYYFELGEITDEGLARGVSDAIKTGNNTGGPFSEGDPLLRMFREKCLRTYSTDGNPVDLVLFYSKQYPYDPLAHLKLNSVEIDKLVADSQFTRIWLYTDWYPQQILWKRSR